MLNQLSRRTKILLIIGGVVLVSIIIWLAFQSTIQFTVSKTSVVNGTIATNEPITLTLTRSISNANEIIGGFQIVPAESTAITVKDKTITITPIAIYKDNQTYTITLPLIKSTTGAEIKNYTIKLKTKGSTSGSEPSQNDIDTFTYNKYPFLKDLINSSDADMTVTYGYPNDVFTIYVDIQPYLEPAARNNPTLVDAKIVETYNHFTAAVKAGGGDVSTIKVAISPNTSYEALKRAGITVDKK